ncbi:hypothetical protein CANCADRAFT_97167 [Tortispora caseinolytica NRRL Y-17796]|uniref:Uncharacterized protein n=1 Tax=Tortispora caseinolytica NRRL Y-17796 TaxID=767744 RepID=A0A1E4TDP5_9ASCO|nr:hypothetical protein CANCADRAFT_97167 [Tortispora caseinolytica NRRL Y-17796]
MSFRIRIRQAQHERRPNQDNLIAGPALQERVHQVPWLEFVNRMMIMAAPRVSGIIRSIIVSALIFLLFSVYKDDSNNPIINNTESYEISLRLAPEFGLLKELYQRCILMLVNFVSHSVLRSIFASMAYGIITTMLHYFSQIRSLFVISSIVYSLLGLVATFYMVLVSALG